MLSIIKYLMPPFSNSFKLCICWKPKMFQNAFKLYWTSYQLKKSMRHVFFL